MDELENINIIKTITDNKYIGDDCAYIEDLGIVITQDSIIEHIHFEKKYCTFEQLGYKSAAVNISDILASGAKPKYLMLALSLPNDTPKSFIKDFTNGFIKGSYGAKLIGGDITGSSRDIMISVTAIGTTNDRIISSRKNAMPGQVVVVSGEHGSSAAGLKELINKGSNKELINAHLMPILDINFSELIAKNINTKYAMMDSSDGLADALYKIAESSNVSMQINYALIPHNKNVSKQDVLFGGEDYKLVAVIPEDFAKKHNLTIIGNVIEKQSNFVLKIDEIEYNSYSDLSVFNHFGENHE